MMDSNNMGSEKMDANRMDANPMGANNLGSNHMDSTNMNANTHNHESSHNHVKTNPIKSAGGLGHQLSASDPDNPMRWPLIKKIYASLSASAFAFAVAFSLTSYTAGIFSVMEEFQVSLTVAIIPFSIYFVGIAFAPIHTPHWSERYGRVPIYYVSLFAGTLFVLGASLSHNFATLCICRFLAGFCGGPCLVLIEGTFADVWAPSVTVSYYAFLSLASYIGAGCGILITGFPVLAKGWRWSQYIPLMVALAAYLFGIGMPETYGREIIRARARRAGKPHYLSKAPSGTTFSEMAKLTVVDPLVMLVSEPIVIFSTLYVSFLFGTIFQFFVAVPAVLHLVYGFNIGQAGLAFTAALGGALLAAATCVALDRFSYPRAAKKCGDQNEVDIEYRLLPAMLGTLCMSGSLFWIGWTALPTVSHFSPILGTALYVYGNMMCLVSTISYLFDAYPPQGTLSALTAAASVRLLTAAAIPLCIIPMILGLGGNWAYSTFGFIALALAVLPFLLYLWGADLRSNSKYAAHNTGRTGMSPATSGIASADDLAMKMSHEQNV